MSARAREGGEGGGRGDRRTHGNALFLEPLLETLPPSASEREPAAAKRGEDGPAVLAQLVRAACVLRESGDARDEQGGGGRGEDVHV